MNIDFAHAKRVRRQWFNGRINNIIAECNVHLARCRACHTMAGRYNVSPGDQWSAASGKQRPVVYPKTIRKEKLKKDVLVLMDDGWMKWWSLPTRCARVQRTLWPILLLLLFDFTASDDETDRLNDLRTNWSFTFAYALRILSSDKEREKVCFACRVAVCIVFAIKKLSSFSVSVRLFENFCFLFLLEFNLKIV